MDQEQKPPERSFIRELVPDWRPTREQLLWAVRIAIVLVVLLGILTLVGLPFDITLWEWLDLLIIPIVLALGGYLFTRSENRKTQEIAEQQRDLDRKIADARRQDDLLQAYLDGMSQLLTDGDRPLHRAQPSDNLSTVARARTLTALSRLDGGRKRSVVQFLYESGLIGPAQTRSCAQRSRTAGSRPGQRQPDGCEPAGGRPLSSRPRRSLPKRSLPKRSHPFSSQPPRR